MGTVAERRDERGERAAPDERAGRVERAERVERAAPDGRGGRVEPGGRGEPGGRQAAVAGPLGQRLAPLTMAHERTLPVPAGLAGLFVEGGLVRGRVLSCVGSAATSSALALVAPAVAAGAWLALVDVPTVGLDAASELGVCLERIVAVDLGDRASAAWADVVAATADGFDLVLTRVPPGVPPATARSVATRLHQRGVVAIVLGEPGTLPCDGVVESADQAWEGVGDGFGHLRRRTVLVEARGRRMPRARRSTLSFRSPPAGRGPLVVGREAPPDLVAV